jgi:hypothetical protein
LVRLLIEPYSIGHSRLLINQLYIDAGLVDCPPQRGLTGTIVLPAGSPQATGSSNIIQEWVGAQHPRGVLADTPNRRIRQQAFFLLCAQRRAGMLAVESVDGGAARAGAGTGRAIGMARLRVKPISPSSRSRRIPRRRAIAVSFDRRCRRDSDGARGRYAGARYVPAHFIKGWAVLQHCRGWRLPPTPQRHRDSWASRDRTRYGEHQKASIVVGGWANPT